MSGRIKRFWQLGGGTLSRLRGETLPRLFLGLLLLIFAATLMAAWVEYHSGNVQYESFSDAVWWALVTMTTVGYGDKTPVTGLGRAMAVVIMFSGISLTALFTAIVASYYVEKRIREGKGMEVIKWKKHLIMCGWNDRAMKMLQKFCEEGHETPPLALVNDLPEEHVANILQAIQGGGKVKYVRGDFVHEGVLLRANVKEATAVVVLADFHGAAKSARVDDRTVLACLTVRSLNPRARLCAEVEDEDSIAHLRRANVDAIVHGGDIHPFLLANAATNPGVTMAAQELFTWDKGHSLRQIKFPQNLIDATFAEAAGHYRQSEDGLLVGVVAEEEEGMGLDDILSGDMSAVDRYIKKKFEGLEEAYFTRRKRLSVSLAPPDDYVIRPNDMGLIITRENEQ